MERIDEIRGALNARTFRSAWERGVRAYALDLLSDLNDSLTFTGDAFPEDARLLQRALLNGAPDWHWYSDGGCSLLYDGDIAERLCSPSELRRTDGGRLRPNRSESWLDVQARALFQAGRMICAAAFEKDAGAF